MRQREIEAYAKQHYATAWQAVQRGLRATALSEYNLTNADKAFLYEYSSGGYETLNAQLHAHPGTNTSVLEQGLVKALEKLPPYEGEVLSGVLLRPSELLFYRACHLKGRPVHWPAFLSATLRPGLAMQFLRGARKNCLFVIQSKTGRLIEAIAEMGLFGAAPGQNEREVLFAPGVAFEVLAVQEVLTAAGATDYTRIVLDEL